MTWLVGVDEAGYGPNLGPFVMASAAFRVADGVADLWHLLRAAVRRPAEANDGRIVVGDSKEVYSPTKGLAALEASVLAVLPDAPSTLHGLLNDLSPSACDVLRREPWYTGGSALPAAPDRSRFADACRAAGVTAGRICAVVVCPDRFNALTDAADSKAAVLAHGLGELVRHNWDLEGDDPLTFAVDKHGGRNAYAGMLQDLAPEGMVIAESEGAARSVYRLLGGQREVRWTFQPRADAEHFGVALASMVAKYLRERLMGEFNAFWRKHLPELKPTAGYPADAKRFYAAIRPLLPTLGLSEDAVWRRR